MAKAKPLSKPMRTLLETGKTNGLVDRYSRIGTALALVDRDMMITDRAGGRYGRPPQLTDTGVAELGLTWKWIVDAAHSVALDENARMALCPDLECPNRQQLGTGPGDAQDRLIGHVSFCHLPARIGAGNHGWRGGNLSAERRAEAQAWLDRFDGGTGVWSSEVGDVVPADGGALSVIIDGYDAVNDQQAEELMHEIIHDPLPVRTVTDVERDIEAAHGGDHDRPVDPGIVQSRWYVERFTRLYALFDELTALTEGAPHITAMLARQYAEDRRNFWQHHLDADTRKAAQAILTA